MLEIVIGQKVEKGDHPLVILFSLGTQIRHAVL